MHPCKSMTLSVICLLSITVWSDLYAQDKCTKCPSLKDVTMVCVGTDRCAIVIGHCGLTLTKACSDKEKIIVDTEAVPTFNDDGKKKTCSYTLKASETHTCRTPRDTITFDITDEK